MPIPKGIQLVRKPVVQRRNVNGEIQFLRTGWFTTIVKDKDGSNIGEYFELGAEKSIYFTGGVTPFRSDEDNSFLTHVELDISNGLLPMPPGVDV